MTNTRTKPSPHMRNHGFRAYLLACLCTGVDIGEPLHTRISSTPAKPLQSVSTLPAPHSQTVVQYRPYKDRRTLTYHLRSGFWFVALPFCPSTVFYLLAFRFLHSLQKWEKTRSRYRNLLGKGQQRQNRRLAVYMSSLQYQAAWKTRGLRFLGRAGKAPFR